MATSLVASWTKPGLNGGPDILAYAVEYREAATGMWIVAVVRTNLTELQLHGLAEGTEYQVRVQAINDETPSAWSDASDAVSTNAPATIPPGLEVTLQLSDDFPLEGSRVTVTATVSPASPVAFTVTIWATPVAPATAADFTLSTNRVLRFAADATESTGTVRITPVDDDIPEPDDVVRVSGAVSNAAIQDPDDVTLSIFNDDIEDFDLAVDAPAAVDEGAGAAVVTVTLTSQKNTAPVTNLELYYRGESGETATRGADYTPPPGRDFGITGIHFASVQPSAFSPNAAGTAWVAEPSFTIGIIDDREAELAETIVFRVKFSEVETPAHTITIRDNDAIVPGRPTGLQAAPRSPTVIQLSWTAPEYVGSSSITAGYRVEASENASGPWSVVAADTRNTRPSWGHGGLSAGATRHYRVSAISPAGTSGPSNVASATTIAAGPAGTNAALPPPQDVNAESKLPGEIRLSWWRNPDAPSHNLVDRHQYRYRVRDAGAWTVDWTSVNQTQTMPPPGTTEIRNYNKVLLQGLTAGTTYEFQVRSVDKADHTSAAVAVLGTATGRQTVWIVADVGSVAEGEPLRFTLWRDQRHGPMMAIVRISETGDMLPPDGRSPEGLWHEEVHFGDGNESIPLVLDTVDDGGATEPDSTVTVEVMPYPLYPDNPNNEHLYDVQPDLGPAKITVTAAAGGSSSGSVAEPLTAAFEGLPATHDGERAFRVRVAFSEDIGIGYQSLRDDGFTVSGGGVSGGGVTGARRVDGRHDLWSITVKPETDGDVTIALPSGRECAVSGAICTRGENRRQLSNSPSATVEGPPAEPLTASFDMPGEHTGDDFTFGLTFSEELDNYFSYRTLRDEAFEVTGGAVRKAQRREQGSNVGWTITVEPNSDGAVTIRLPETSDCGARGAICTGDGRALSTSLSATVAGLLGISVVDARVEESAGAVLEFAVTLERAAAGTGTVDYATSDGSAQAGDDYTATSGTLTFRAGESAQTIEVAVLDDSHDEGEETLTLRLSNPSGGRLADGEATGTIKNTDPMPKAWLARFGRAASDHAVGAIEGRWRSGAEARPQTHLTLGGRRVENPFDFGRVRDSFNASEAGSDGADPRLDPESTWARMDRLKAESLGLAGGGPAGGNPGPLGGSLTGSALAGLSHSAPRSGPGGGEDAARSALLNTLGLGDLRQILMGSSFFYARALDENGEAAGGSGWLGNWSAWGETAATRFSGADGPLSLDGEVATATLGADRRWGRWHGGVALSYSEGDGVYTHPEAAGGAVTSTLTSLHPFARYELNDRTSLWGVLGYGSGALRLTPAGAETGIDTDLDTAMAAFGGRGVFSVRSSRFGAFELAVVSDVRVSQTVSDSVENLMGTTGATSRVRVMLEGSGSMPLATGGVLKPTLEAGLRYDDGDAETGAGLEIGAGLGYAAGVLAVEVKGRMLLAHEDTEYEEWGFSGSIRYQPRSDGRGLSMNLGSTWGATQSGVQSLWSGQDASSLVRGAAMNAAQRFQAELGYGFTGRRKTDALWMPFLGAESADGGAQSLRMGVKLTSGPNLEAGLEFGRLENGRGVPERAVQLRGALRW